MRIELPKEISSQMKLWRNGLIPIPQTYIAFHKELATQKLDQLMEQGLELVTLPTMESDGWCDGMKVLHVRAIIGKKYDEKIVYLKWNDGNQEFFIESKSGGSFPFRLNE